MLFRTFDGYMNHHLPPSFIRSIIERITPESPLYASEVKLQRRRLSLWRKRTFVKVATPTVSQTVCCKSLHRVLLVVDLIHLCFEVKQIQGMTCISASTYFQHWSFEKVENLAGWFHTLCSGSFHIQKCSCFWKGEGLGCSVTAKEWTERCQES